MIARFLVGDVFARLAELEDGAVDLVVTSPPFLALRSYLPADHPDKAKELGSEATPAEFVDMLLRVTAELRRVLAPHGSICVELGDTYSESGGAGGDYNQDGLREGQPKFRQVGGSGWPLAKSKALIPESYRWALAYGVNPFTGTESPAGRWRVRNNVTWCRPNPPVGALGDKWRPATSDVVVACLSGKRFWDDLATRKPLAEKTLTVSNGLQPSAKNSDSPTASHRMERLNDEQRGAPLLDYWEIPPGGYSGSHYACVDADTEALTPEGWKPHDQLCDGQLIAAYDAWRDVLRWEPATFHRYDFDGELVAVDQRETVQRLTPNHRVLYRSRSSDEPKVTEATGLKPSHRLPVAAPFDGYLQDGPGEKLMALLGWFITEGNMRKQSRQVYIYQSMTANPHKCAEIRGLLDSLGADYDERHRERTYKDRPHTEASFVINGELAAWLRSTGKAIPGWVLGVSDPELQSFFDALIDGDGHRRDGRLSFVSKDEGNADMFQAVAARLGYRSTIMQREVGTYEVTVGERSWLSLRGTNGEPKGVGREHYQGTVWCPSVPSSFWLARRSGRPFITGNTFPPDLVVPLVKAMCPRRVCRECGEPSRPVIDSTRIRLHDGAIEPERVPPTRADANGSTAIGIRHGMGSIKELTDWTDCGHDDWRPGLVLDPFAGSGTTLMVAHGHGFDSIGIDLDERNAELALERVGPFFLDVEERV